MPNFRGKLVLLALWVLATGCSLFNKEESVPAIININSVTVLKSDGTPEADPNIENVWVYAQGRQIGSFTLPARIPVPNPGATQTIEVFAGVRADGISDTRVQYPFLLGYTQPVSLAPKEEITIEPVVTPANNFKVLLAENFENNFRQLDTGYNSVLPLEVVESSGANIPGAPGGGQFFGRVRNTASGQARVLQVASKPLLNLLRGTRPLYLEFQYRCNLPMQVGLYGYQPGGPGIVPSNEVTELTIRASPTEWKKIYVFLSEESSAFQAGVPTRFFIRSLSEGSGDDYIAIDNVRLLEANF